MSDDYADEIASHPHGTNFLKTVYDTGAGFPDMERLWEENTSPWVGNVERYSFDSMAWSTHCCQGGVALLAHHVDATFGNISIRGVS